MCSTTVYAITGSGGYIGNWLQKGLAELNTPTVKLQRYSNQDQSSDWSNVPERSHVVHLAGRTSVVDSWDDPVGFFMANATSTLNLLERCRSANCSLTYISSYSYGQPEYLPIDESHQLSAVNPYGFSKISAEQMVRFYADNYALNANVLRLFNVYGPGQQEHLLIPTIVRQLLDPAMTEIVVKDLAPKRDYLYISDVISAIIAVAGKGGGEVFNLGSGKSYTVEQILDTLIRVSGRCIGYCSESITRKNEIPEVVANIDKLRLFADWQPNVNFETGLEWTYKMDLGRHSQRK